MRKTVQIDQAGRLILPKRIREHFHLEGGDKLSINVRDDAIELRAVKSNFYLEKVKGVLVLKRKLSLSDGNALVTDSRDERLDEIAQTARPRR